MSIKVVSALKPHFDNSWSKTLIKISDLDMVVWFVVMAMVASPPPGGAAGISRVHVIAHSHNDPGWLLTDEQYYDQRSKLIISNVRFHFAYQTLPVDTSFPC